MAKRKVKHYDGTDDSFVDPDAESYMHDTELMKPRKTLLKKHL